MGCIGALASPSMAASERARVSIAVDACAPGVAEDLGRIAALELHATRVPASETAIDVTRIAVTCESPDEVALHVTDPLTSKEVTRNVSVAGVEERARARTIALAVAELVSASWAELETTPEPQVQPIPKRVPARRTPTKPPPPPIVFQAVAGARVFFGSRELLLGGGVAIEPWLARSILLRFDGFVEHASSTRLPGAIDVDAASTAASFGLGQSTSALRFTAALGLRVGYARLAGFASSQSVRGQALDGAWVGPELRFGLELFPRAHVHAVIDYAIGWAAAGVVGRVPGDRDVLAYGPYGALAIGFAAN